MLLSFSLLPVWQGCPLAVVQMSGAWPRPGPLRDASRSNGAFLGAMAHSAVHPTVGILMGQGCPHLRPETAPRQEGPRSLRRMPIWGGMGARWQPWP